MDYGRITVTLPKPEKAALFKLAELECRNPREQAAYMIRIGLEAAGLLKPVLAQTAAPMGVNNDRQ